MSSLRQRVVLLPAMALAAMATSIGLSTPGPFQAPALVVAAGFAVAGFGLTRKSLTTQIASRGTIALGAVPLLLRLASGTRPELVYIAAFVASAAALALSRPALDTEDARRAFAPARYRSLFLAGATAMTTAGVGALAFSIAGFFVGSTLQIAFNAALAALLFVAVRGLLAMRTWGLLLGALTSTALLALAPFYGATNALTLTLAAVPALAFWVAPLLLARRAPRVRVAGEGPRVAIEAAVEAEELIDEVEVAEARQIRF